MRPVHSGESSGRIRDMTHAATATQLAPHIVSRPGVRGGRPTLDTIAITVDVIAVAHERLGMSVEDLVEQYEVTRAQVYAALTYYLDHKAEIDARIKDDELRAEKFAAEHPPDMRNRVESL